MSPYTVVDEQYAVRDAAHLLRVHPQLSILLTYLLRRICRCCCVIELISLCVEFGRMQLPRSPRMLYRTLIAPFTTEVFERKGWMVFRFTIYGGPPEELLSECAADEHFVVSQFPVHKQ